MKQISVFEELKRLRKELDQEKRLRIEWQNKYYALEKELKEVKDLLNQFLNSNTPSSQLPPQFKPTSNPRPEKGANPRGKPEGSNGAAKEAPARIGKKIKVECPTHCGTCGKRLHIESYTWCVYDIAPVTITVTEVTADEGHCEHCNVIYKGTHPDVPAEGIMGPNLQAFFTELKHNFAGSYGRISEFFESLTGHSFSPPAINDCIERVAAQLEPSYKELEEQLPLANYSHGDETSWPVNGMQWWLWLFITASFVFITIKNSRARKVLTGLFGEAYSGVIISDCLKVYRNFAAAFEKDWAHLLRKTHFEAEKYQTRNVTILHQELMGIYKGVEEFQKTCPSFEQRVWQSIMCHQKLQRITRYRWSNPAKQIVNDWLKEYEGQWLVPLIIPEIPLTNNINERGIRKVIPTRKLLGGHRTEIGARNFAIIETHRQTWRLRNESSYNQLVEYLRNHNIKSAS